MQQTHVRCYIQRGKEEEINVPLYARRQQLESQTFLSSSMCVPRAVALNGACRSPCAASPWPAPNQSRHSLGRCRCALEPVCTESCEEERSMNKLLNHVDVQLA